MASLLTSLSDALAPEAKIDIVKHFWLKDIHNGNIEPYRSYFQYYAAESERLQLGPIAQDWESSRMIATTHEDIVFIVRILAHGILDRRPEIRNLLRQKFPSADDLAINRSLNFAMRIWLTINVREERTHTPQTP